MSREKPEPSPAPERLTELVGRDHQELWFTLAKRPWRSAVLVPAEVGLRSDDLAVALAGIGRRLGFTQVSSLVADQIDFDTVGALTARVSSTSQDGTQLIVAIPPVVIQPLGVAVARAADAVVLCVALGHTRIPELRRTIELVGRERIRGAVLVPSAGA